MTERGLENCIACVAAAKKGLGEDIGLAFDCGPGWVLKDAIQFARAVEPYHLAWLAIPTWGEAWHNNHHAFPTSYRHGLERGQIDPSAAIIRALELTGLAWDVVRVAPERRQRKALPEAA